jgi:hypothetical protein
VRVGRIRNSRTGQSVGLVLWVENYKEARPRWMTESNPFAIPMNTRYPKIRKRSRKAIKIARVVKLKEAAAAFVHGKGILHTEKRIRRS